MLLINPREKFHRNKEFELIKENKKNILKNKSTGGRVEIDGIGSRILEYLPSNLNTIKKKLETEHNMIISYKLLYFYLLVFWKGHLIEKTNKKIKFDSKKTGSDEKKTNISIVIVTYNGEKFINENLNSIQNQIYLPEEIIIVDNASSDNTINILKKYATRVKLIRNKKNLHYAKGVNIGVQNATGDIIVILNQDVVLDDHFLAEVEKKYQSSANKHDLAAIVPQMRFMKLKGFINSMGNRISNRGWGSDNYFGAVDIGQLKALKLVKSTCFGAIAITQNGWKEVGKLDEKYGSYYEDVDWSFRAHLKAKKMIVASDAIVYHHFRGSYDPGLRLKFVIRNRLRFILKNFSGRVMFGFSKNYLFEDLKNSVSLLKKGNLKDMYSYIFGYLRIIKCIPEFVWHHLKRKSANRVQIDNFFRESPGIIILSNDELQPVINKEVIRSYYYFVDKNV